MNANRPYDILSALPGGKDDLEKVLVLLLFITTTKFYRTEHFS
ncbi:MAG: hypothetical protein AB3N14_10655 [Flavobacteriaceae bacterium]